MIELGLDRLINKKKREQLNGSQNLTHICFALFLSNQHYLGHCLRRENKADDELLLVKNNVNYFDILNNFKYYCTVYC